MDNQNQPNQNAPNRNQQPAATSPRQQVAARLQQSNNLLVTVAANPSVDQLAACIGLTLILNRLGKHAAAVFSGAVPSTLEFLQPEKTIEKNTDSLRDFIIALDKSKADKLRYKVEDKMVKIFITPYRTSIKEKDLEFSQGDFNVDAVVALGVHQQQDLDQAITAHGRILHDAPIVCINDTPEASSLGTVNWQDTTVSSLSEMVTILSSDLGGKALLDSQVATALLTGIVAVTSRFSNEKTTSQTMSASAQLLAAGANQQLVATQLESPKATPQPVPISVPSVTLPNPVAPLTTMARPASTPPPVPDNEGTLTVDHGTTRPTHNDSEQSPEDRLEQIRIDTQGTLHSLDEDQKAAPTVPKPEGTPAPQFITQPPMTGAAATSMEEQSASDLEIVRPEDTSLSLPPVDEKLLTHHNDTDTSLSSGDSSQSMTDRRFMNTPLVEPQQASNDVGLTPGQPQQPRETLSSIEENVQNPDIQSAAVEPFSQTPPIIPQNGDYLMTPPTSTDEARSSYAAPLQSFGQSTRNEDVPSGESLDMPIPTPFAPPQTDPNMPPTSVSSDPLAPPPPPVPPPMTMTPPNVVPPAL